jgi:hypothetical protein
MFHRHREGLIKLICQAVKKPSRAYIPKTKRLEKIRILKQTPLARL